jgi:hypothetical protein
MTRAMLPIRKHLVLSLFCLFVSSLCVTSVTATASVVKIHTIKGLPAFNKLIVKGPIAVTLLQNARVAPSVQVYTTDQYVQALQINSTPNTLTLTLPAKLSHSKHPVMKIIVRMPQVARLSLAGKSQASAFFQHQNAPVVLYLRGRSSLTVSGIVNLRRLTQYDQSRSTIVFTNSQQLDINLAQLSFATIAGQAQHLRASTRNDAVLSGRYLRSHHSWLKSSQHSSISLSPLNSISAFATQSGQIFWHTTPQLDTTYVADRANILRVR